MPLKRKITNPPMGGQSKKKRNQIKKEDISALTEQEIIEKIKAGKNENDNKEDEKAYCSFTRIVSPPKLPDKNQDINAVENPIIALNQLLLQKSKLNSQGSLKWKVFLFPSLSNLKSVSRARQQYFGLDLVDEEKERTYWTHKPSVWQTLFASVIDLAKTGKVTPISPAFSGILSCPIRAVPNGPNDIETFRSGKGQNIQHWIMLVPMPSDIDYSEYIPIFISKFQDLYKKPYIKSAYKSGVSGITTNTGMINQLSEEGSYWNVLDNTNEKEIMFRSFTSLSEVLLDKTIEQVVPIMFGVKKDPNTWTDDVKAYAYGN